MYKKLYKKNPYLKIFSNVHFLSWFSLKENHEIAGITNCEITKCGDPLVILHANGCIFVYLYTRIPAKNKCQFFCEKGGILFKGGNYIREDIIQGIPAFRDFTIRDPRYFVILFQWKSAKKVDFRKNFKVRILFVQFFVRFLIKNRTIFFN